MPYSDPDVRREHNREYQRRHVAKDPEKRRAYQREWARQWRKNNPEAALLNDRRVNLMRNYGMTIEDFDALLEAQGGRCAICGTDTPNGRNWHVDHNHDTGKVRGILCSSCNLGIGFLSTPERLAQATQYLITLDTLDT